MSKIFVFLLLIILVSLEIISAETIVLKSGKIIDGKIIEETDAYVNLETSDGQALYFYKNTIDNIKRDGFR